ncbi:MAG: cation-translocating P-type ATPase [Sandaracinaceae bacterium]
MAERAPEAPWARPVAEVAAALAVDPELGLPVAEGARRRLRWGANRLREHATRSALSILWAQLRSVVVLLLAVGAAASFAFQHVAEGVAILAVIVLNAALGFVTELRAVRSLEALRTLGEVQAVVRRRGVLFQVPAVELVPGDIVLVEAGDVVTADLRVVDASAARADESALTGESIPVDKEAGPCPAGAPLAERTSMLFKGTSLTHGAAEGVVVGSGMNTELGRVSALVEEAEDRATPLERRIARLGRQLVGIALVFVALAVGLGATRGQDLYLLLESAVALAVATVPEGLPIVATVALARGVRRMAVRHALVENLAAVETLGSASLILTDKTGTLTENRLSAVRLLLDSTDLPLEAPRAADGATTELAARALRVAVLSSEASPDDADGPAVGDPLEVALVEAGARAGLARTALLAEEPEIHELAFDPATKMSATVNACAAGVRVSVKGAPEAVLAACQRVRGVDGERPLGREAREAWLARNAAAAAAGLRVLALAEAVLPERPADEAALRGLTLLGLVGLRDPPRATVRHALDAARAAGLRVVIATGDQAPTALAIARALGLVGDDAKVVRGDEVRSDPADAATLAADVVARATPEQKLRLLRAHQQDGRVVAMLGDGVNDAPALKQADIGVAMGQRGTEVARQAADMVLVDDELASVVAAVEQGRVIFGNLRRFVIYLLGCNLSEILIVGLATAIWGRLPLLPLQILFLNLVTDVFPAAALGVGEGDARVMERPPRDPSEPFLTATHWRALVGHAIALTAAVLLAYGVALGPLGLGPSGGVTVAFLTLGFAQLWHVFAMAGPGADPFVNEVTRNPWIWRALILCTGLILAGVTLPYLSTLLGATSLPGTGWALALGVSVAPVAMVHGLRAVRRG